MRDAFRVGHGFVARGAERIVDLFRKRWSIERLFGRAKEWMMLDGLRIRGVTQVSIPVISFCVCGRMLPGMIKVNSS